MERERFIILNKKIHVWIRSKTFSTMSFMAIYLIYVLWYCLIYVNAFNHDVQNSVFKKY